MIRVLMVVDGFGGRNASFGVIDPTDDFFSFTYFVSALAAEPGFHLTKAHRGTDPGNPSDPSITMDFRFDEHDLSAYDVILLFGFASDTDVMGSAHPQRLSDAELFALATFMDSGGGVFATGDHESLGRPLCGLVPRVRSMRKWYFPLDGSPVPRQFNEPDAPPGVAATVNGTLRRRLDTTMTDWSDLDPSGGNWFDDQSDDNPQILEFRYPAVPTPGGGTAYVCWADPIAGSWDAHPVLWTTVGIGRSFPDHMHEGEIITPWESDRTFTFQGTDFVEYPPAIGGGIQPLPQIIAWSFSGGVRIDNQHNEPHAGDAEPSEFRPFGAVGVYDGQQAGVGRVLVDSTFHHFVDINLIGDPTAVPPKTLGFRTTDGQPILDTIGQYFRNIVFWLAPPGAQANAWHSIISSVVRNVVVREAMPHLDQARSVQSFGHMVASKLRARLPEPTIWALATAALDRSLVRAIASGTPAPCNGPDPGIPSRRAIGYTLIGATAATVLTTKGRGEKDPAKTVAAGQRAGLALLADAAAADARRQAGWSERLQKALSGKRPSRKD